MFWMMASIIAGTLGLAAFAAAAGEDPTDFSPRPEEQQLPKKMHSAMKVQPTIKVGREDADIVGNDNRALQAAVDYIAGLGGGIVEIGPGEYLMKDSLHMRSNVTIRGTVGKTILRKAPSAVSALGIDGDYGEEQFTVVNPAGFEVGAGVAVWDNQSGGFHTVVGRITGRTGNTFALDHSMLSDYLVANEAKAATVFPVVSGCEIENGHLEDLIIDGNKINNVPLNGCRGAGIYLYRGFGVTIERCVARNFNGDGISFQQSNDVVVQDALAEDNAGLGLHPGSGSQRPVVRRCTARRNSEDGLFLCWRVRHGLFENNTLENNGRFGISIGHKDSDNLLRANKVVSNGQDGIFFRNEALGMAGHRNRLEENIIENNGKQSDAAGIRVRGETQDLILRNNTIRDTRPQAQRHQVMGVCLEEQAGPATLENNTIEAQVPVKDLRKVAGSK